MLIVIDTREQHPLVFPPDQPVIREKLDVGDYGIKGFSDWKRPRFVIERKSLDDLANSLGNDRERFMKEIEKLRQFGFRALVIEGTEAQVKAHRYTSQIEPSSIFGTLDALRVRANVHVIWSGDAEGAARDVERLARMFCEGVVKDYKDLVKASIATSTENTEGKSGK